MAKDIVGESKMSQSMNMNSDSATWNEKEWTIGTSNVPVYYVEVPNINIDIVSPKPMDVLVGDFYWEDARKSNWLDAKKHETLLEKNVKEYSHIWRILAEK